MLTSAAFGELVPKLKLTLAGVSYVKRVRESQPSRAVSSHGMRNTTWRYASHKMGCTIQAESTLERNFLVACEYHDHVLEFWDQPEPVGATFIGKSGKPERVSYTPDFLVIESTRVIAYQVKPIQRCSELVLQRPSRWKILDNQYIDEAAASTYQALGITHIVITEKQINAVASENYALLLQAKGTRSNNESSEVKAILSVLSDEKVLTIGDLLRMTHLRDTTTILNLIEGGAIAALLDKHRLADKDDALVGLDRRTLEDVTSVSSEFQWQPSVVGVSHAEIPNLKQLTLLAERRRQLLSPESANVTDRTLRRWRNIIHHAKGACEALIPKIHLRGNRSSRLSTSDLELIHRIIKEELLVPNPGTPTSAFYAYVDAHHKHYGKGNSQAAKVYKPVSLPTFLKEVRKIPLQERSLAQGGSRLANVNAPPIDAAQRSLQPLRAFERAHIDHYKVDQHVVTLTQGSGKKSTERPWLTAMIDQATHVVLAISISFRSPSRRSCACIMRDCVKRHGRLPENIVVDHGSEFESVYFEALLARYGVTKHERPSGDPRFGGPIESAFHSIREELIRSLKGSTSNDERGRSISPSHRGQAGACWRLADIYFAYQNYFYKHFNLKIRSRSVSASISRLDDLLEAFPHSGKLVQYDAAFFVATAIPLERSPRITHLRGITHFDRWFFHPEMMVLPDGTKVAVLEEPWDERCVYASINGKWLACWSGPTHAGQDASELRMLNSITFLETQSERKKELVEGRASLAGTIRTYRDKIEGRDQGKSTDPKQMNSNGRKHLKLPQPVGTRPEPYQTKQGERDEHQDSH